MFQHDPIRGVSLPDKTLSLTFDDGPGPHTLALAAYLYSEGIQATFFVVGRSVEKDAAVVSALVEMGHRVGNHTYSHPDLVLASDGVVEEVLRTSVLLESVSGERILFRAPYGSWSPAVADVLNDSLVHARKYHGPIGWDVDGRDWEFWRHELSVEECAERYIELIESAGRGIVLLHDWIADGEVASRTYEMVKILIPRLRELGYTFTKALTYADV